MAHISGYTGSISFTGGDDDAIFSPSSTEMKLTEWEVTQLTDSFGAFAKGEAWEAAFGAGSEWGGRLRFLPQDILALGEHEHFEIRESTKSSPKTFTADFESVASGDKYTGSGIITGMRSVSPLEGPYEIEVNFEGDGALTYTGV
jgi:hypothetical protein